MATVITSERLKARFKSYMFNHDVADATVATKIGWKPIKGFESFLVGFMVIANALVTMKIFAATASDGTGATEVIAKGSPTSFDAAGDTAWLECTEGQIRDVLAAATHLSAEIDMDNAAGTGAVVYIFGGAHRKFSGQTADVIS